MKKVDNNDNCVFKHDQFLMSFQVFKSYMASHVRFKHLERHQKPVVFNYRVLIVIYFFHLFLYIKFSLHVLKNLLLYIHIYTYIYIYVYIYIYIHSFLQDWNPPFLTFRTILSQLRISLSLLFNSFGLNSVFTTDS